MRSLRRSRHRRHCGRAIAGMVATAAPRGRGAPDQLDRRRYELRHARVRPAAACLRRRPPGGWTHRRAEGGTRGKIGNPRSSGAAARRGDARHRRLTPCGRSRRVMGGVDSEVSDDTRRIVLESANFDMKSVRRTARELRLRTDASARFERGLDPNLAREAAARATRLILDLSPGATVSAVADVYPQPRLPRPLSLPFTEIERLLGIRYDLEQVLDVLSRLGFSPTLDGEGDAATLRLIVPTWRSDVTLAADVVEEVARVIGYETLPERLPTGQTAPVQRDPVYALQRAVRSVLTGAGGWETVTYIAISDDELRRLDPESERSAGVHQVDLSALIRLRNPLQADRDVLRPTLLPSLLAVAAENLNH